MLLLSYLFTYANLSALQGLGQDVLGAGNNLSFYVNVCIWLGVWDCQSLYHLQARLRDIFNHLCISMSMESV